MTSPHENGHGHRHGHGNRPGHGHGHAGQTDFSDMAELLDLDGLVFHAYLEEAMRLIRGVAAEAGVRRVADLGCGTGTATLALARLFPDAEVVAVDVAEPLLEHLMAKARAQGLAGRVRPVPADLEQGLPPEVRDLDLVWASASVHHVSDPPGCLAAVHAALTAGGRLALAEVDDVIRFQPMFLTGPVEGRGGLEARVRSVLAPEMTAAMPFLGADWAALLRDAGFTVEADQVFDLDVYPPPDGAGRYAALGLRRMREQLSHLGLEEHVSPEDLAALDELTADGPQAVVDRQDLAPRARRHVWLARRDPIDVD